MVRSKVIKRYEYEFVTLKITPHKSVLNSQNRKLQAMLFELFNIKHEKYPWQHRKGFHIAVKPNPSIWWSVKMYVNDEEERHIEFYVSMPKEFLDAFKTKFKNHEQWRGCTLEEVKDYTFPEIKDTDVYSLKYKRSNMFSLNYDYTQQHTPIRDLMTVSNDLAKNEAVDLYIRCEALDRFKWKKLSDYAFEVWKKESMPYRSGLDPKRIFRNVINFVGQVLFQFKSLFNDVLRAVENSFYKNPQTAVALEAPKISDPEREAILLDGSLSKQTTKKRTLPTFLTTIRYFVHSPDPIRRGMLARSVANYTADLNGNNELVPIKITIRAKKELNDIRNWKINEIDPNVMSIEELGKLYQLPTSELQEEFKDSLASNQRIEIEIPKCFRDPTGIYVGTATIRNEKIPIHISVKRIDSLMSSRAFIGSPRQGKDQALINFVVESKRKHGIGAIVLDWIDEHGIDSKGNQRGLSDGIRNSLEPNDFVDLDLSNYNAPVWFGLQMLLTSVRDPRIGADTISKEITNFLMGEDAGSNHQTREYVRDAAKVCFGDWINMKRLFTDEEFREKKIEEMEKTFIGDPDLWQMYHGMSPERQAQIFTPVNVRMGEILNDEVLKPIFCQLPNPKLTLEKWIIEGKVLLIRMKVNDMSKKILAHFLTMLFLLIKFNLNREGACTWMVINEPHQIETPDFTHFMKRMFVEGPKYRLAPVLAFHHLGKGHLSQEMIDALYSANISWHMFFNSNINTYDKLKTYIEPFTPEEAMKNTPQYHFIAAGWRDEEGITQPAFISKAPDPVKDRWGATDNSKVTEQHAKQYGRPIDEVLRELRERTRRTRKKKEDPQPVEETPVENSIEDPKPVEKPPQHVFMNNKSKGRKKR